MQTREANSWVAFESDLEKLRKSIKEEADARQVLFSPLYFRGQCSADWSLATTLDRRIGEREMSVMEYRRIIEAAKPEIEAHTKRKWDLIPRADFKKRCKLDTGFMSVDPPDYEFLAYLRHHGFPSPLLDWSRSPYVAAFFAFRSPVQAKHVAIYAYCEMAGEKSYSFDDSPQIKSCGPYVSTHTRHFLQQCTYTLCQRYTEGEWKYSRHERVFSTNRTGQDMLWKFSIPASERQVVLKRLDEFNLNPYSLFGSEDS